MLHSMIKQEKQYEVLGHSVNEEYLNENEEICEKNSHLYSQKPAGYR